MRRVVVAAAAAVSIAAASLLVGGRAEAMPLPGAGGLGVAGQSGLTQDVRTVCRTVWNGFAWVQNCYWVPGPRPYYYGPRYYGPPRFYRPYRPYRYY
jgi:hypothetical protein